MILSEDRVLQCRTERHTNRLAFSPGKRTDKLIQFKSEKLKFQKVFTDLNPLSTLSACCKRLNVALMLTKLFSHENAYAVGSDETDPMKLHLLPTMKFIV